MNKIHYYQARSQDFYKGGYMDVMQDMGGGGGGVRGHAPPENFLKIHAEIVRPFIAAGQLARAFRRLVLREQIAHITPDSFGRQ